MLTDAQLAQDPIFLGDDEYPFFAVDSSGCIRLNGRLIGVDKTVRRAFERSLTLWQMEMHSPFGAMSPGDGAVKEISGEIAIELIPESGRRVLLHEHGASWRSSGTYLTDDELFEALRSWASVGVQ